MNGSIKRILIYTHNSIGLGHAFRTLAVISGMKKWRPDIDFMVISGTSIPHIFFAEGIEVIKLPSIKLDIDHEDNAMHSRYLTGFELESIFDFRQQIILASFDFFQPDVLIIEHNMTGQMSELIPLLMKKWMRQGGPVDFALVHICRGIMKWLPILEIPYQNPRHRSESINIGALYDFMYVLEDREVIDINREFLGSDPQLEEKISYLGKITCKLYEELPTRDQTLSKFCLQDKPIVLITLGRNKNVFQLTKAILNYFEHPSRADIYQVVIIVDPYFGRGDANKLKQSLTDKKLKCLDFIPDLVELIRHAELVISRAGYNTVNEILLTGAKALIIPESHGGGEQELRAKSLPNDVIRVVNEDSMLQDDIAPILTELLALNDRGVPAGFNKYSIGKKIIDDLEQWKDSAATRGRKRSTDS